MRVKMKTQTLHAALLAATTLSAGPGIADDFCGAPYTVLPAGCEPLNAGAAVAIPAGANTEFGAAPGAGAGGFSISINGQPLVGDARVDDIVRRTDVALANADVQVTFDGLDATPRLDLEIAGPARAVQAGDVITFQSALNYPAYVTRGEVRIIDLDARGGPRTVLAAPIDPNGQVSVAVPDGGRLVAVHRVYDANGRYDETAPLALSARQAGQADGVEEGADSSARRNIPVYGGAVTVSGSGVAPGATVRALGESIRPDGSGGFVIQRILPPGDYGVDVQVAGGGQNLNETRDIEIPKSEWFYIATVDLTYGINRDRTTGTSDNFDSGRLAFYADGRTASGWRITGSADTGEEELQNILRRFDERDPRSLLLRVDPDDLYPTYGDGSTIEDRTPTSGKLYARIERDGTYLQWGDFKGTITGDQMVRNERSLYGLSMGTQTRDTTTEGEARASATLYAAQPDMLPQRDVFLGTGGSVYFLEKQDIAIGTETISIQIRDRDTGRVIETRRLTLGEDYQVNTIQGIVTLSEPLSTYGSDSFGGTTTEAHLVVNYEYTPTATDLDGFAYGGRAEAWVTDQLRIGTTATVEQTGTADQTATGVDLLYRHSDQTWISAELARTDGPGFGSTFSADGGLVTDTQALAAGTGRAVKVGASLGFGDIGLSGDGVLTGYYEQRTEGFATPDTQVTATTGDETLWGFALDAEPRDGLTVKLAYDAYENAVGDHDNQGSAELAIDLSDSLTLTGAIGHEDKAGATETGNRTTAGLRLDYALSDATGIYGYGRTTVQETGLGRDDRYGLGATHDLGNGWSLAGELSDGTAGAGGRILANYEDEDGNSRYLGYELDPTRELGGLTLDGRDQGRVVAGGTQALSEKVSVFGENSYDLFGDHRTLTTAYGLTYAPRDELRYTAAVEYGTVTDAPDFDFTRTALTFGVQYETEQLRASGRVEYRVEEGVRSGDAIDTETLLLSASAAYKLDDSRQIIASANHAQTNAPGNPLLDGDYTDIKLGYAIRPVDNDRFNLLARYRYLADSVGQRVDGTDETGPVQRSHVMSVDASYDLNREWTIGGKLGYRMSESAPDAASAYTQNDAWLAVVNARWHVVHDWDALIEVRQLTNVQAGTSDAGALAAVYKHFGDNLMLGVGYNFGRFSDDLTDLTQDDDGAFINLVAQF